MPTLREIFSNTADAIRTKTGKSESIYPVDMASEIEGIESGGGYKLEKMPSGAISSFNDGTDLPLNKLKVSIEPVQSGSGDPSPTNVRPFSGWSAVNMYDTGKNLCDFADKTITKGTYIIDNAPVCLPSGLYVLSFDFSGTTNSLSLRIDDKNGNSIFSTSKGVSAGRNSVLISLSQTGFYVKCYSNAVGEYSNFQIEQGTTPTTYEAFSGTTYTIQFKDGDNPLTVYGGSLDVVSGVLTVDKGYIASYNGETLPSTWISDRDVYAEGTNPTTGAQVVYELATPQTYQLTPTAVRSLIELNNIWADTGDIINGEYFKRAESGGGQLTQIEAFESGSVSLIATNGVTISSYTINEDMSADITFSESSAGYEGCILGSFENLEIGKSYLLKFEYEFNDAQIMAGYCLGAGIVENPVNDYENANQFNNFVRDSNRHSILLFFDYNFLNTNLVLNLSALDDAQVNKFKLENIRIYEIDSNI